MSGSCGNSEALRNLVYIVAVTHPRNALRRNILKKNIIGVVIGHGLAVFADSVVSRGDYVAAERIRHELTAVAYAENRNTQLKNLWSVVRRALVIYAVGSACEDDALGVERLDFFKLHRVGQDFAVHIALANPSGDKLIVLTAEIEDNYRFLVHIIPLFKMNGAVLKQDSSTLLSVNDVAAGRAVGYHLDRHADFLLGELNILAALLGQLVILGDTRDRALPALELFENRLASLELCG